MVKEPKNIDFYTSGKKPSDEDFARISTWIKNRTLKATRVKKADLRKKPKQHVI